MSSAFIWQGVRWLGGGGGGGGGRERERERERENLNCPCTDSHKDEKSNCHQLPSSQPTYWAKAWAELTEFLLWCGHVQANVAKANTVSASVHINLTGCPCSHRPVALLLEPGPLGTGLRLCGLEPEPAELQRRCMVQRCTARRIFLSFDSSASASVPVSKKPKPESKWTWS